MNDANLLAPLALVMLFPCNYHVNYLSPRNSFLMGLDLSAIFSKIIGKINPTERQEMYNKSLFSILIFSNTIRVPEAPKT